MRRSTSARRHGFPLVVGFILSGCPRIDFETETVVSDDGSVVRTARYVASDTLPERPPSGGSRAAPADENHALTELEDRYVLLDGGDWEMRPVDGGGSVVATYTVTKRHPPGEPIPSDHVRRGSVEGRMLRNDVRLSVRNFLFVKVFDYRELHRDAEGRRHQRAFVDEWYEPWSETLAENLASEHESVDADHARQVVRELTDPWVGKYREGAFIPELSDLDALEAASIDALVSRFPAPPGEDGDDWRERVSGALEASFELVEGDRAEEFFGSFDPFRTYGFSQSLTMPGAVTTTNAHSVVDGVLAWEFDDEWLVFQDYALEARSRIVYPGRIGGAAALAAALSFALVFRRRQRRASAGSPNR